MNHLHNYRRSFDIPEVMDSDASGSSGRVEGGEGLQDDLMGESEGVYDSEDDYEKGHLSGDEGEDKGAKGSSNYSEDLDFDNEIKLGDFSESDDVDSEFDDWKAFDEEEELDAERSDEDAMKELEEMMGDEEYAELWSIRRYSLFHMLPLFINIFSYRE
jgi:hypothetical protein